MALSIFANQSTIPLKGVAYSFYVALKSVATVELQANPTLATGDVKISKDGGGFNNLGTLPEVLPAAGRAVKVTLSAAEMAADRIVVQFVDATGSEWHELMYIFSTIIQ